MKAIKKETNGLPAIVCIPTRLPESFSEYSGEDLMSNCDRQINKKTEEAIKGNNLFSIYAGWNFCGKVWWQDNKWLCEVWCHGGYRETFVCDSTEEIMEEVSLQYGYE